MSKENSKVDALRAMREARFERRDRPSPAASEPKAVSAVAPAEIQKIADLDGKTGAKQTSAIGAEASAEAVADRAPGRRARQPLPPAAPGCKRCAELARRAKAGMEEKRQSEKKAAR